MAAPGIGDVTAFPGIDDSSVPAGNRARAYLDSNCSHCHRPGGVHAFWDARFETPLGKAGILDGLVQNHLGLPDARVVVPGHPESSVMLHRLSSAGTNDSMPPIAKAIVDERAVSLLAEWIMKLPAPVAPPEPKSPWQAVDIGAVSHPGHAVQPDGDSFVLRAGGRDIWEKEDSFHFLFRPLKGDGQITARVSSLTPTSNWAKAGVMFRESLAVDAPHAMMALTPGQGAAFQSRRQQGAESEHVAGPNITAPYWVRLARHGNEVIGFVSTEGREWTEVSRVKWPSTGPVMVGMALCAHHAQEEASAVFDEVDVQGDSNDTQ